MSGLGVVISLCGVWYAGSMQHNNYVSEAMLRRGQELFTPAERLVLLQTNTSVSSVWPELAQAHKTLVLLKRLVFARTVGELMDRLIDRVGVDYLALKFRVVGYALQAVSEIDIKVVMGAPEPEFLEKHNRSVVAVGLFLYGASLAFKQHCQMRTLSAVIRSAKCDIDMDSCYKVQSAIWIWREVSRPRCVPSTHHSIP